MKTILLAISVALAACGAANHTNVSAPRPVCLTSATVNVNESLDDYGTTYDSNSNGTASLPVTAADAGCM